eukprot:1004280-Pelagomonas_calceolata.AAC.1
MSFLSRTLDGNQGASFENPPFGYILCTAAPTPQKAHGSLQVRRMRGPVSLSSQRTLSAQVCREPCWPKLAGKTHRGAR